MSCFDLRNIMVVVCLGEALTWGAYSGGNGSLDDPYELATEIDWRHLAASPVDWGDCFVAVNDVDFQAGLMPVIGTTKIPFSGQIDGQGRSLSHLISDGRLDPNAILLATPLNNPRRGGLFGSITGVVMDLVLVEPVITATNSGNAGALAALVDGGQVLGCHVEGGKVLGRSAGGLIGWAQSAEVEACTAQTFVVGQLNSGGLIGAMQGGTISQCKTQAWVVPEDGHAGGLIGLANGAFVKDCYSEGTLVCTHEDVILGGVVGYNGGTIVNCYGNNSFFIRTLQYSGGVIGRNTSGAHAWTCLWNQDKSPDLQAVGGSSDIRFNATTQELMSMDFVQKQGWDLAYEVDNGSEDIWVVDDGVDVPRLRWEKGNTAPVAAAGPDQAVKATGSSTWVVLNGTGSYDYDGDIEQWQWTWTVDGVEYQAVEARPLLTLPLGIHEIELRVYDGELWSEPDTVNILVSY